VGENILQAGLGNYSAKAKGKGARKLQKHTVLDYPFDVKRLLDGKQKFGGGKASLGGCRSGLGTLWKKKDPKKKKKPP